MNALECNGYTASVACAERQEADKKCADCPATEPEGTPQQKEDWRKLRRCCDDLESYKRSTQRSKDTYCGRGGTIAACPF